MKTIAVLGSTGSIGRQTLDVVDQHAGRLRVAALAAGRNVARLTEQALRYRPDLVAVADREAAEALRRELPPSIRVVHGEEGLIAAATHPEVDVVVSAVVGAAGLLPTLAAIEAGKTIALANKETLVMAGELVMRAAKARGVAILPVDSEHSAIFQCLQGENRKRLRRLILTASGGALRDRSREELADVTVADVLAHPNWQMGAKVTVDSATMMNKGLEVIEAHWLFGVDYAHIDVLLHRESVIHSMVEWIDGSVIAQLGTPDMRIPIQYALTYPDRWALKTPPLNLADLGALHFAPASFERYPLLALAYECGRRGGTAPAVLNAANEVAVEAFLQGRIPFLAIERIVADVCARHDPIAGPSLSDILEADRWAREAARTAVAAIP
ncbi:1-deoxy-D-xylulose-5-phosphate reductoisomerase [Calditerricola satsumensis]|uniref:1-deoxy-D-xylulose 5-phosphate reductoisomerase n=2 Tax=Calditerricola satsumensis TaxID=373054 RepID=A0A8J3BF58_9BACI|nr:1-deoxy-D-xylulose-5-phosphate reductoisomerase [Calditerricola satsumensis]GGJ99482.1 1-deoxy-D-xylulose 5-phosphate reductoisomerase 2 [Calditerricola satsumensis]